VHFDRVRTKRDAREMVARKISKRMRARRTGQTQSDKNEQGNIRND
jgi:hypothetical protein